MFDDCFITMSAGVKSLCRLGNEMARRSPFLDGNSLRPAFFGKPLFEKAYQRWLQRLQD